MMMMMTTKDHHEGEMREARHQDKEMDEITIEIKARIYAEQDVTTTSAVEMTLRKTTTDIRMKMKATRNKEKRG